MIFLEKEAEQDESSEYMEMSYRMGIAEDKEKSIASQETLIPDCSANSCRLRINACCLSMGSAFKISS